MSRKGKRRTRRNAIAILLVAWFVFLITIGIIQQQHSSNSPKKPAAEYFKVTDAAAQGVYSDATNNTVELTVLGFSLKAVGGDAHYVNIIPEGMTEPYTIEKIVNGSSEHVEITFAKSYITVKVQGLFYIDLYIVSSEAEGDLTITLDPDNIHPY